MTVSGDARAWALGYAERGWRLIPLTTDREGRLDKNPGAFLGAGYYAKASAERAQVEAWCGQRRTVGFGMVAPLGLDVDHGPRLNVKGDWVTKAGADTFAAWEAAHGPVPQTYRVSARRDGVNGIRLLAMPGGLDPYTWPETHSRWLGAYGDIEVVRADYRHVFIIGDHPDVGRDPNVAGSPTMYGLDGKPIDIGDIPKPTELPALPETWLPHLRQECDCPSSGISRPGKTAPEPGQWWSRFAGTDTSRPGQASGVGLPEEEALQRFRTLLERYKWTEVRSTDHGTLAAFDHPDATQSPSGKVRVGSDRLRLHVYAGTARIGDHQLQENRSGYSLWDLLLTACGGDEAQADSEAVALGWLTETLERGKLRSIPLGRQLARERLRGRFLYVTGLGWHEWDGTRWKAVEDDKDQSRMVAVAADWAESFIIGMIKTHAEKNDIDAALRYRDVGMARQLLAGAKTDPQILRETAQMDAKPGLLNCVNGTVDLRTGKLQRHDPADLLTKSTGVAFRPDATHPDWDKALRALPDDDAARYVRIHVGSAASGESDRSGPVNFHQGDGENGKTTLIGGLTSAFGDYSVKVPDKLLTSHGQDHDEIWMPLRGARLAYLEELPEDHTLPIARIKKLVETAEMDGRPIGGHRVTWRATHSLLVSTNYQPLVAETDHGTWRRLVLVPYPHTFGEANRDTTLRRRVRHSRPVREAVLAWIVSGAVDWYAAGMELPALPASIAVATLSWRKDNDVIAGFLIDQLRISGEEADRIPIVELHERFNHTLPSGARPWNLKLFSSRIRGHHMVKNQTLGIDRGPANRGKTALVGVVWNDPTHHTQGLLGVFQ